VQTYLIPAEYQQWARNCDEYIFMGREVEKGVVQIIHWADLRWRSSINDPFCDTYTLSTYELFQDDRMSGRPQKEYGQACEMVVSSARILAGQKADGAASACSLTRRLEASCIISTSLWCIPAYSKGLTQSPNSSNDLSVLSSKSRCWREVSST
jgi:hypothetical protein